MQQKQLGTFLKYLIIVFICIVVSLILFRNHFFFGTALIIGRWGFLVIGAFLLFLTTKRIPAKRLQYLLLASLVLISLEFIFTKINEAPLKKASANSELTFMTYNLFFKNKAPDIILNQIKEINPDVLVVQELTPSWVNILSTSIGQQYPYKRLYSNKGTHGIGIYSKYKLSKDTLLLNESKKPFAQLVKVYVSNKKIQIINTHLASPAAAVEHPEKFIPLFHSNYLMRENQVARIELALRSNPNDPYVLIGDLNTTSYEPLYRTIRTTWVDIFNEVGKGNKATFPNTSKSKPFLTLDYILIKGSITPISAEVLSSGSSDHLALVGKVKI